VADQLPESPDQFDRELDFGWINKFMIGLTVLVVVSFVGLWLLSEPLKNYLASGDAEDSPLLAPGQTVLPPQPHLQVESYADWAEMETAQDLELDSYGWVEEGAGRVRIPVQEAMDQIAEHGLPSFESTGDGSLLTPEATN
jgi:hypothetical protein